jgi:hypothetical protein
MMDQDGQHGPLPASCPRRGSLAADEVPALPPERIQAVGSVADAAATSAQFRALGRFGLNAQQDTDGFREAQERWRRWQEQQRYLEENFREQKGFFPPRPSTAPYRRRGSS